MGDPEHYPMIPLHCEFHQSTPRITEGAGCYILPFE